MVINMCADMICSKLYTSNNQHAYDAIMQHYLTQHYSIISFLYFASMMHYRLLEPISSKHNIAYARSLQSADFLLPDGIALQVFSRCVYKRTLHNLNGTDFIPYFLDRLQTAGYVTHIGLISVYDPDIGKDAKEIDSAITYIHDRRQPNNIYTQQSLYTQRDAPLDEEAYKHSFGKEDVRVCLVCIGTPQQEIWVEQHRGFFEQHKILVFNAGGLVDYWSGFEKRAPQWVVKTRVLETPWRILQHPKKNIKKFFWMFGIVRWRRYRLVH